MNTREAFLKVLSENEDDIDTRNVYADWLEENGEDDEAERQRKFPKSKEWLKEYAREVNCYDHPDVAFVDLIKGLKTGELFFNGTDLHGLYELEKPDDLKRHAEIYLGISIDWGGFIFCCSC